MTKKTAFLDVFGESPILKVLDFFMINEDFDYSMTDIAAYSGVGYSTLKLFWPKLVRKKFFIHTRTVGRAKMYELNTVHPTIKKFKELYWQITKQVVRQHIKKKRKVMVFS